jgi:penicillin-binding protein 1A
MTRRTPPEPPRQPAAPDVPATCSPLAGLLVSFFSWSLGLLAAGLLAGLLVVAVALAMAYPQLPDVSDLADYKPKLSMRVFSLEGKQIGEFGEERRNLTPFKDIPPVMVNAVLAIEDARFYQHGGLDYIGLLRASLANLGRAKSQGASTITMQVARNVYLSSEKTFTRKIYEILLTFKLEHLLTKDQILEIYLNQIYLGQRAYGFAAASETYFGNPRNPSAWLKQPCWRVCPRPPRPTTPSTTPSAHAHDSSTSSSACSTTASSPKSRPRPPNVRN